MIARHAGKLAFLALVAVIFQPAAARASAPPFMPIQGLLTDSAGNLINGDVAVTFTIYDAEVSGTPLWSEAQTVLVEDGLFAVYLGEIESIDLGMFLTYTHLWLGIQVESDPEMDRVYLGSTPFTGYAEYCGNIPAHSHPFSDVTGTISVSALPDAVVVGPDSCPGTDKAVGIDSSGELICATDQDTTYLAGSGLTLSGRTFSVNTADIQARVSSTCSAGSAIRAITSTGTVSCETDDDTLAGLSCSTNQVAAWNGSRWACASPGSRCSIVSTYSDTTCYRASSTFATSRGYSWCTAIAAYPNASAGQGVFTTSTCSGTAYGTANSQQWWCVNYALQGGGTCYSNDYYIGANVYLICCS
jgi:hypothetical protein